MIFDAKTYRSGNYSAPNRGDRNLEKNTPEYHKQVAEYMYSQFCKGNTYISYDYYTTVARNRAYALGLQDKKIYQDAFYGKENSVNDYIEQHVSRKARRKAYANLNFEIHSPMPRVMDSIIGKLVDLVNRVSVDGTDEYSTGERENLKYGTFVEGKFKDELAFTRSLMNLPNPDQTYIPKTVEELNLYEAEGGFKLVYEEVMEELLKFTMEQSYWEETIIEDVLDDLVTLGYTCVVDEYDKYSGMVKNKYVDAEFAGVQYTRQDSNYNPDYGFYTDFVKLSDMAKKVSKDDTKKIEQAMNVYSSQFGNPSYDDWNKHNKSSWKNDGNGLDNWVVPVFVVYWKDVDFILEKQYNNRQGSVRTKPIDKKYKLKQGEKELVTNVKTIREVHWAIATDIVYDWGVCEFQGRDGYKEPVLPIHMVQVQGRPLVPRLIPSLDQFMNAWMKYQNGMAMAVPAGQAINMDAVSNIPLDGKTISPLEVLRIHRQTGNLFYKPTDMAGRQNTGGFRPIEQIPGGAGTILQEAIAAMQFSVQQIEELTGINPLTMGGTPGGEGKAVSEYSIMGTNDILKRVLRKANIIKSNVSRNDCLRLSHVVQADKRAWNTYKNVVGETRLESLKIASGHDVKYGIRTHARPTREEEAAMKEMLAISFKNGRDGKVGIKPGDYIRFIAMMENGTSLKRIALLFDYASEKAEQEAQAKASKLQQENIQGTQALEAQKSQQEQQILLMKTQADIATENTRGRNDILAKMVEKGELSGMQALMMIGGMPPQQQQAPQQPVQQQQEERREMPAGAEAI